MSQSEATNNRDQVLAEMFAELNRSIDVSFADWHLITGYLKVSEVPAKYCLQPIGAPVRRHHFIVSGLVRLYYITPEGKDVNKGFYSEGHIIGSLSGLILDEPSRFGIETIDPCVLVEIDLSRFHKLMAECEGWANMFHYSCQRMLIRNERREAELLTLSAKERYLQFCKNFSCEMARIPQYHIASYLGVTPVALSRYKNQWLAASEICS